MEVGGGGLWRLLQPKARAAPQPRRVPPRVRTTPKTETRELPGGSPWISALVLGLWDNTCGPRIDQVWQGAPEPAALHDPELLLYSVRLALAAELSSASPAPAPTCKAHVYGELGALLVSCAFGVALEGDPTPLRYVLVLVASHAHLPRYLALAECAEDRLLRLAEAVRTLLARRLPAARHVPLLLRFLGHLDHLYAAPGGPDAVAAEDEGEPDWELASLALSAMVQSGCNAVVVGPEAAPVARMLRLLGWAQPARHLARVRGVHGAFAPDLHLQGVVGGAPDEAAVMQGLTPLAVVDVGARRVWCTNHAPEYAVLRREFVAAEVAAMARGVALEPHHWKARADPLLRAARRAAPWATDTVHTARSLPRALREGYVRARFAALERRALVLVCGATPLPHQQRILRRALFGAPPPDPAGPAGAAAPDAPPSASPRRGSGLPAHPVSATAPAADAEQDYLALLALADALQPGVYVTLAGDPDILESKFVELFESF